MTCGVSNPFKTGRYCAATGSKDFTIAVDYVSNPFKTGRYCAATTPRRLTSVRGLVSNPFKTGRYCAVIGVLQTAFEMLGFQTPSKRGGTVLLAGLMGEDREQ